jgi:hypothetical protein
MRWGLEGPEGRESGVTAQSVGITAANPPEASMSSAAFKDVTNGAEEPHKGTRRPAALVASDKWASALPAPKLRLKKKQTRRRLPAPPVLKGPHSIDADGGCRAEQEQQ